MHFYDSLIRTATCCPPYSVVHLFRHYELHRPRGRQRDKAQTVGQLATTREQQLRAPMEESHVYTVTSSTREHRWIGTRRGLREQTQAILARGNTGSAEMYGGSDRASRDKRGRAGGGEGEARGRAKKEMQHLKAEYEESATTHKIQRTLFGITKTEYKATQK